MRKFSSYGPPNTKLHYYSPRETLITQILTHTIGEIPDEGGHYITIWAPRQTGKTWIMREVLLKLRQQSEFDVIFLSLEYLINVTDVNRVVQLIARKILKQLNIEKSITIDNLDDFDQLFERQTLSKPLILILDEFDCLSEDVIAGLVSVFSNIYNTRQTEVSKSTAEKEYLLHSLALIGVRAVLGVENLRSFPFNLQRSVHIPNFTAEEVVYLFNSYQQESGQSINSEVVERIYYEFQGQPGLTCWFGELLTETYNKTIHEPITMEHFEDVYAAALNLLPNNNILNIINNAKQETYKPFVLKLFQTKNKFIYDEPIINFLYLNGVIDIEQVNLRENYVKFACPYIEKRLFNYFIVELGAHKNTGFMDMDTIASNTLDRLEYLYEQQGNITGIATGFTDFDRDTSGLQPSDFIIVAGRPSMGKTSFAMNIAGHVALYNKLPVAVFCMEISSEQLMMRLMSSIAEVNLQKIRTGYLNENDWAKLNQSINKLNSSLLFIDDTPVLTPTDIRARTHRLAREHGQIGLIIIDYLQLLQLDESNGNRATDVSEISHSLKSLAKELNVPVIALSQLNRSLEQRTDKRPKISDLRESGSLEEDSDLIVFIYRDEVYNPESPDKGIAEIIIGKQRNGPIGTTLLSFQGQFTRFANHISTDSYYGEGQT